MAKKKQIEPIANKIIITLITDGESVKVESNFGVPMTLPNILALASQDEASPALRAWLVCVQALDAAGK